MIIYYDRESVYNESRLHPYTAADETQSGYVDFFKHPGLIESVIEDLIPHAGWPAVQFIYEFLRWINAESQHLGTCDLAFRPPDPHQDQNSKMRLSCHGRIFIMFRDLRFNSSGDHARWLCRAYMHELELLDPAFSAEEGVIGFTMNPTLQTEISNGKWLNENDFEEAENDVGLGQHLMLSFWAYGNDQSQCFGNLQRVFMNLWTASRSIDTQIEKVRLAEQEAAFSSAPLPEN